MLYAQATSSAKICCPITESLFRTVSDISPPLDPDNVDHHQIALAQAHLKASPRSFCAIVTNDQEMVDIALSASPAVPVIAPGSGAIDRTIRRQLARRRRWWKLFRRETAAERPHPVKSARPAPSSRADRQAWLERVVCSLYGRLRSVCHWAILSVALLEARLALTAHLVGILRRHENRVVFLFVEDRSGAKYWADELRQRCKLRLDAVPVFGERGIPQVQGTRVVVYRHPQIESRFN